MTEPDLTSTFGTCYRHPQVVSGVRCARCERNICPDCMIPAPVGHQCPECVESARREFKSRAKGRLRTNTTAATGALMALIVGGFVLQQTYPPFLDWGILYAPYVAAGEYWRLFTVILLHANYLHLGVNLLTLWNLGRIAEQVFGRARYVAIFFVSGLMASAASYAWGDIRVPSVGASGAIFGIFGALIAYFYRRRGTAMGQNVLRQLMFWLMLNVFISMTPGIDWRAHFGGLIGGFVTGYVAEELDVRHAGKGAQIMSFVAVAAVAVVLVAWRTSQLQALGF
jgi:membrane associated rhomboid family serine protease